MTESEYNFAELPFYLDFLVKDDVRGRLVSLEFSKLPFQVKRYFAISVNDTNLTRGSHAHKTCWQAFFVCQGSLTVEIRNLSFISSFKLMADKVLIIPPYNWCEVTFETNDSVMGVLASQSYDQTDYIIAHPPLQQK